MTNPQEPDDPERLVAIGEAARFLGVSTRTVERYVEAGRIEPKRLPSGIRRFRMGDLRELLAGAA